MFDYNDLKPLLVNNIYPCYIRDVDSQKILFANEEFFKVFNCNDEIYNMNFSDVIKVDPVSYQNIKKSEALKKDYEYILYHERENQNYAGTAKFLGDGSTIFCEFSNYINKEMDIALDRAITRCLEIYKQPDDTILTSFMEVLCQYYGCGRAYLYRLRHEDFTVNCISQWCMDSNFAVTQEIGSKMNSELFMNWLETEHKNGLMMGNTQDKDLDMNSTTAKVLQTFKMDNFVFCIVEDVDHKVIGLVGLSNRDRYHDYFDPRLISAISRFLSQDVVKVAEVEKFFHLHHVDTLTGMYNRNGYAKEVDRITETPPKSLGVISVNINGLKFMNENFGIEGGDKFIKDIAKRLKEQFSFEFFRMSGDEFVGLAPDIEKSDFEDQVFTLQKRMRDEGNDDFSMGHAWEKGNFMLAKLFQEAETIMYINKQEYYHSSERKYDGVRDNILSDLLSYLENDEFMIYLQPQVRLSDASLYGAEALIRRFDKTNQKMVFPDQFIPLYEQRSVIRHIDMFVVEAVCKLLSQWNTEGKAIPISVNLSRVTLQEFGIVDSIVEICDKFEVPHKLLVIEVTERVGLIENNVASSLIQQFKDNGFNISLDDFGCAYSNIVTLAQIQVDEVKIDKSLVDNLTTNKSNHILVKNVLTMCNELDGASTLAEGIEDEQQARLLHELGCHLGQGYFYSRPIPVDEFIGKYIN